MKFLHLLPRAQSELHCSIASECQYCDGSGHNASASDEFNLTSAVGSITDRLANTDPILLRSPCVDAWLSVILASMSH